MGTARQRQRSVGLLQSDHKRTLRETAHRNLALVDQVIECFKQAVHPTKTVAGQHTPSQVSQPVTLPRTRHAVGPPSGPESARKPFSDRAYRSLEPWEIPRRTKPQHAPALRTTKTPQQCLLGKSVKDSADKAVPPHSITMAARTSLWSGPRKIAPLLHNLLEANQNSQYHRNIPNLRLFKPYNTRAAAPLKLPPNIKSIYSDNSNAQVNLF